MNWSFLFLFLRTHRQQVPERNQKKKKKMKWRAERSASSHRFHCAILWPPSSCLSFIMHTHPHAHSHNFGCPQRNSQQWLTSGAQKSGMGGWGGVGRWWWWWWLRGTEGDVILECWTNVPSQCLWMSAMLSLLNYLCFLSKVLHFIHYHQQHRTTVSMNCFWIRCNFWL